MATIGDLSLSADSDIDVLAWQFLRSDYAAEAYAEWPLDRRLDGFLRRRGLVRIAEDGDVYDLLLDNVMAHIGAVSSGFGRFVPAAASARKPAGVPAV